MGGLPESLPDLYAKFSPLRNAEKATAPILAVAGKLDGGIPSTNASTMVSAMHAANKRAELIEFPDEDHIIVKPENVRAPLGRSQLPAFRFMS